MSQPVSLLTTVEFVAAVQTLVLAVTAVFERDAFTAATRELS